MNTTSLPLRGMNELAITVHGTPAGQGAVSFLGKGRPAIHSNQKVLKPWRDTVSKVAQAVAGTHPYAAPPKVDGDKIRACVTCGWRKLDHGLLSGPLGVEITISVPRTAAAAKRGDAWPANRTSSDIDHHARAILDALTHASVWQDDAQVVELCARKVWAGGAGIDALDPPGAVIRIWTLPAVTP